MSFLTSTVTVAVVMIVLGFYSFYFLYRATLIRWRFRAPDIVALRKALARFRTGNNPGLDETAGWIYSLWTAACQEPNAFAREVQVYQQQLKFSHEQLNRLPQQAMQGGILFTFAGFMMQADFSNPLAIIGVAVGSSLQGALIAFGLQGVLPWFDQPLRDRISECERVLEAFDDLELKRQAAPCNHAKRRSPDPRWMVPGKQITTQYRPVEPQRAVRLADTDELPVVIRDGEVNRV